jgi:serine/threonine protein phosphatase PrpC
MGPGLVYLSQPNKKKDSEEGEMPGFKFAATAMQGWRINMEDAHIAITNFLGDPDSALFGVFDGHGGREDD